MAAGTPWWSRDSESKDDISEASKSDDNDDGEGDEDEDEEADDMDGDSDIAGAGGMKRRLESRLQAPEKSNLGLCEQDLLYLHQIRNLPRNDGVELWFRVSERLKPSLSF
jgi:hypothetical protein